MDIRIVSAVARSTGSQTNSRLSPGVALRFTPGFMLSPALRVLGEEIIMTYILWIIQVLLALMFLFAGGTKLVLPIEVLTAMGSPNQIKLPDLLIRFIGVCEVLGALGLILPGLLRIRPGLTPLAAAGLLIIMIGAAVLTFAGDGLTMALPPLVVGLLCAFVAYGRWRLSPHSGTRTSKGR